MESTKTKSITDMRVERDLSQVELAKLAGVDPSTVINAELGRPVFKSTLEKICAVLGVKPEDVDGVVAGRRLGRRLGRKAITK